ncbi:hypothetical protein TNCV_404331 [Trichonephila clavipes]|nr:hypothetical protein TNCV_404331 [Trichonephila clavipes]
MALYRSPLTVTLWPSSFLKKYGPMIPPAHKAHQTNARWLRGLIRVTTPARVPHERGSVTVPRRQELGELRQRAKCGDQSVKLSGRLKERKKKEINQRHQISLRTFISKILIVFSGERRRTDASVLLQYLHNGISNASGIDFVTVPSTIKYRKFIVDLLESPDTSNPTALLTAHATGSSISNEVTLEIDSHSNSIAESICTQKPCNATKELDKVIKERYALMQHIRFEKLSLGIQKEMFRFENGGKCGPI